VVQVELIRGVDLNHSLLIGDPK